MSESPSPRSPVIYENLESATTSYEGYEGNVGERGSCGVGAIVNRLGAANRTVVELALSGVCALDLRGGKVEDVGDGAGIILRTKGLREFFKQFLPTGARIPDRSELFAGSLMIREHREENLPVTLRRVESILARRGIKTLGWRVSEHAAAAGANRFELDTGGLGVRARENLPVVAQLMFEQGFHTKESLPMALHRAKMDIAAGMHDVYVASMEPGTVTYKAMSTGAQLARLYDRDFQNSAFVTDAAASHDRFATNVLSRDELAQPFRRLLHNGEINTIAALRAATRDLERSLRLPSSVLMRGGSDSGDLDRITSLFHAHGVPLSETVRRLFQPTPDDQAMMPENVQQYHRAVRRALGPLSAAEGPAAIIAMDAEEVIGILDGLGLRPLRVIETNDDLVVMTSEIGAPYIPVNNIRRTFQLDAGEMVIVTKDGRILYPRFAEDAVVKKSVLNVRQLTNGTVIHLPANWGGIERNEQSETRKLWNVFGANKDTHNLVTAMAKEGKEPVLGLGWNKMPAVFSTGRPNLFRFLHQIVAIITNPPMDPIREGASMDTRTYLGRRPKASQHGHEYKPQPQCVLDHPFMSEGQYQALLNLKGKKVPSVYRLETKFRRNSVLDIEEETRAQIERIKRDVVKIARGKKHSVIVLSDRGMRDGDVYIPSAIILAAVHSELLDAGLRRHVSLVCDTGETFEAHDMAALVALGADAVNPYLVWQSVENGTIAVDGMDKETVLKNLMTTYASTLKRIMSKMGITSVEGYRTSKKFEAVGVDPNLVGYYLGCPASNLGGATLRDFMTDIEARSRDHNGEIRENPDIKAYEPDVRKMLEAVYWKHPANPNAAFQAFVEVVQKQAPFYFRDLLQFSMNCDPYADFSLERLDELKIVSVKELYETNTIVGSAMSVGAVQNVAHRALSGAFNELGGSSNSGEGGVPRDRNPGEKYGADTAKIRQRASAMFGLDAEYLINAEEIEIKIGQGAKPGEGGHLPGFKVSSFIAKLRHTQIGIDLISPPPLHDVYSIEDLARLMQDLRAINSKARVGVKITANTDIGTVAVGAAKAGAEFVSLSGWEGSTGAAVSSAIEHTGLPLEKSLAEVHQALTRNKLRDLVKIRVDGGIKTGDDIVKLACLGADQFALGMALLVAGERCIACHSCSGQAKGVVPGALQECPTGITPVTPGAAKQLGYGARKLKPGELPPNAEEMAYHTCKEATRHYLTLLAQDVRRRLAAAGKKTIEEIVGDTTMLQQISRTQEADRVRLNPLLVDVRSEIIAAKMEATARDINRTLIPTKINAANRYLIDEVSRQLTVGTPEKIVIERALNTADRSFGATLAGMIASKEISAPLGGIYVKTNGYAGQSFGFCNVDGVTLEHVGFANDFVSMGQSGGTVVLKQPKSAYRRGNSIGGNACAYGATGGKLYGAGKFGQRFGVRNSGATLVSEGTGKYPYEYMTGGIAVDLARTGRQAGAGSTGGRCFLRDDNNTLQPHHDVMITKWTLRDKKLLRKIVEEYAECTESEVAGSLLKKTDIANSFRRVVPKDHYVNAVTTVLSHDFCRLHEDVSFESLLGDAVIELSAYCNSDEENEPLCQTLRAKLLDAKKAFTGMPSITTLELPYRFEAAKKAAWTFVRSLEPHASGKF